MRGVASCDGSGGGGPDDPDGLGLFQRLLLRRYRDKARKKRWALANRDKVRAYMKAYRVQHSDRLRAKDRVYATSHRAQRLAYERHYRRWRPEVGKAVRHARRAAKKAGGRFAPAEFRNLCAFYGQACLACWRDDVKLTPDHVIPLCHGGRNDIENIQPLCLHCNMKKHRKHTDYRQVKPDWIKPPVTVAAADGANENTSTSHEACAGAPWSGAAAVAAFVLMAPTR